MNMNIPLHSCVIITGVHTSSSCRQQATSHLKQMKKLIRIDLDTNFAIRTANLFQSFLKINNAIYYAFYSNRILNYYYMYGKSSNMSCSKGVQKCTTYITVLHSASSNPRKSKDKH